MLKPPRVGGAEHLRLFIADVGGIERAARIIDVHPNTMLRWLAGTSRTPQAALQALYWLSRWGYSDACSEAHWSHQTMLQRVRELEQILSSLQPVAAGTATTWRYRRHWRSSTTLIAGAAGSRKKPGARPGLRGLAKKTGQRDFFALTMRPPLA